MNIQEYIKALVAIMDEHGSDLEVQTINVSFDRVEAREPTTAHALILNGRQSKPRFFNALYDEPEQRGGLVVRV